MLNLSIYSVRKNRHVPDPARIILIPSKTNIAQKPRLRQPPIRPEPCASVMAALSGICLGNGAVADKLPGLFGRGGRVRAGFLTDLARQPSPREIAHAREDAHDLAHARRHPRLRLP